MSPEKTEKLYSDFPDLYQNRHLNIRDTCMVWGFECGDGWYNILYDLSSKLEPLGVRVSQVKEKYGTLTVYLDAYTDGADVIINEARDRSARTCEKCGSPGKDTGESWIRVRCEECK